MSDGDWIALNGTFDPLNIDSLTFRVASTSTQVPAGQAAAAAEVRLGAVDGPVLVTATITSTGNSTTWQSQTVPITDPGGPHKVYLVFRSIAGGQTGNNLFNLNWVQFDGQGVSVP